MPSATNVSWIWLARTRLRQAQDYDNVLKRLAVEKPKKP
jgi:hypothetical protein